VITGRKIGDSLKDAVTWAQDMLRTTRPIAEQVLISAIQENKIIWNNGVILLEDDDDMEDRKRQTVSNNQIKNNAAKKWSRIHFRNQNRNKGKNSLQSVKKQAASKFSNEAEDMLNGKKPAALPHACDIDERPW